MTPTRLRVEPGLWTNEPLSEGEIVAAVQQMADLLVRRFPSQDLNCLGPIALGRHLAAIAWKRDGLLVPPAPPEIQALLKSNSPQGRHEILTLPGLETIPALYEYDLRLAYLWCCKRLPYGQVSSGQGGGDPERGHKILAYWWQPEEWEDIGLLPYREEGWIYPRAGKGWIDRREVDLAIQHRWALADLEYLRWKHEGALDRWSDGIQWALRQTEEGSLVYRMLRRVALWTIGSFHRTTTVKRFEGHTPPIDCANARYDPSTNLYQWTEEIPLQGSQAIYAHPEWTTTIWARCRARIASFALQVPREQLIAIRQDAIYTSTRQPQWENAYSYRCRVPIGGIRRKWCREERLPAPCSIEALEALQRGE